MSLIKNYFNLAKPGMIMGNMIPLIGGFFLASRGHIDWLLLLAAALGLAFVIGGGCVLNNYIDRRIDALMERTRERELVRGVVPARNAIVFGIILELIGFYALIACTNILTAGVALFGLFFYLVMYTIWKRRSIYGTLVGAVAGAVPPVVGYCAVANRIDTAAILLFIILVLWQMPHFFAIAIRRLNDYIAADIPVLPVKKGIRATKIVMLIFIILFTLTAPMLTIFQYAGYLYGVAALILGLIWLVLCVKGFFASDDKAWARKMFLFSLIVLMAVFASIPIDAMVG